MEAFNPFSKMQEILFSYSMIVFINIYGDAWWANACWILLENARNPHFLLCTVFNIRSPPVETEIWMFFCTLSLMLCYFYILNGLCSLILMLFCSKIYIYVPGRCNIFRPRKCLISFGCYCGCFWWNKVISGNFMQKWFEANVRIIR